MKFQLAAFADESSDALSGQIHALQRNHYQFLEIRNVNGKNFTKQTVEEAKEVAKQLADNGLAINSLGSPIGKIKIHDDFNAHMEKYKHTLELAHIFGAEKIRLFSFYIPKEENPENYRDLVLERVGILAQTALASGIIPCHENEKGIYGDGASRCLELHKAVPGLKAVFDPANFVQCGQDTLQAWELLHPYVSYMHIKDALPDGRVVVPGTGAGNVPTLIRRYADQGGTLLSLEPHLFEFVGLKALEQEDEQSVVGNMAFETSQQAFDYAAENLKKILEELS